MPELPEVETIKRGVSDLQGKSIIGVQISDEMLLGDDVSVDNLRTVVSESRITAFERIGKYLIMILNSGMLLFSLRMTGNLIKSEPDQIDRDSYVHFQMNARDLWFTSVRRFSRVHCYRTTNFDEIDKINQLGPDPTRSTVTTRSLKTVFANRTAPIKTLLMNQKCLAGLGNIYANEICHAAGIDPRCSVQELNDESLSSVAENIGLILDRAIELGGSSIRDFNDADGENGDYQDEFYVYGRDGKKCVKCGELILKDDLAGRGTYWCPDCQSQPDQDEK